MAECTPFTIPVTDDNRGISGKDASFLGDISNAGDRAAQDRYLAGEFRGLGVSQAERAYSNQKDHTDHERFLALRLESLSKDVERNGRSAELATEKTGAATILAIEKTAAAALLAIQVSRSEAELCCCKASAEAAANTASILAAFQANQMADLQRQLTVFQVRAVAGTGSSPV